MIKQRTSISIIFCLVTLILATLLLAVDIGSQLVPAPISHSRVHRS